MRFLHTADWHLGRLFHQIHLTEDQAHVLDQIVQIIERRKIDAVFVAGDLYDRAVPPPEAVNLLDNIWNRIVFDLGIPVVAISGNHDSSSRIAYGSKLLSHAGLHVFADLDRAMRPVTLNDVDVFALPYAEPAEVRAWSGNSDIRDHQSAFEFCIEKMSENFHAVRPKVLLAHAFVAGMKESESERPLSVGGSGIVSADVFSDFNYVALGHLHAPQKVTECCYYSGSPMKYSFSEANHRKSVIIGEIDSSGDIQLEFEPLIAAKDVRTIEGELSELITRGKTDTHANDYLHVSLTDEGALLNAMNRLREVYPNVMQIDRQFLQHNGQVHNLQTRKKASESELFKNFLLEITGDEPTEEELSSFNKVVDAVLNQEREVER